MCHIILQMLKPTALCFGVCHCICMRTSTLTMYTFAYRLVMAQHTVAHRRTQRLADAHSDSQTHTAAHRRTQRLTDAHSGSQTHTATDRRTQRLTDAHSGWRCYAEGNSLKCTAGVQFRLTILKRVSAC